MIKIRMMKKMITQYKNNHQKAAKKSLLPKWNKRMTLEKTVELKMVTS